MAKDYVVTSAGLVALQNELEELKTVRRKEVAEKIKEARGFGDLSENSEYDEAKNEQGKLYSRIAEVKDLVENAVIIEKSADDGKVVTGSKVTVKDMDDDYEECYQIVGSQEADPMNGRISDESPMGRALVGHVVGDKVEVEAPVGKLHFEIIAIEN